MMRQWRGIPVWAWVLAGGAGIIAGFFIMRSMRTTPTSSEEAPDQWKPVGGVIPQPGSGDVRQIAPDFEIVALKTAIANCQKDSEALRLSIQHLKNGIVTAIDANRKRDDRLITQPQKPTFIVHEPDGGQYIVPYDPKELKPQPGARADSKGGPSRLPIQRD